MFSNTAVSNNSRISAPPGTEAGRPPLESGAKSNTRDPMRKPPSTSFLSRIGLGKKPITPRKALKNQICEQIKRKLISNGGIKENQWSMIERTVRDAVSHQLDCVLPHARNTSSNDSLNYFMQETQKFNDSTPSAELNAGLAQEKYYQTLDPADPNSTNYLTHKYISNQTTQEAAYKRRELFVLHQTFESLVNKDWQKNLTGNAASIDTLLLGDILASGL